MLQYLTDRISSKNEITKSLKAVHFKDNFLDGFCTGRFMNLSCGHNNQYSFDEKLQLTEILNEAIETDHMLI